MHLEEYGDWTQILTADGYQWRPGHIEHDLAHAHFTNGRIVKGFHGWYAFIVESNHQSNLIFVDASSSKVGIGTSTPNGRIDV